MAGVGAAVTWGLLAAWAVHDAEELATMPHWFPRNAERLHRRLPFVPLGRLRRLDVSRAHATVAIAVMGLLVAAAAADGARTGGRSGFFRLVLLAFGLHALVHVGQSVVARLYTPGVVTAVVLVAPFGWWAWSAVRDAGLAAPVATSQALLALVLAPAAVLAAHGVALVVLRVAGRRRTDAGP